MALPEGRRPTAVILGVNPIVLPGELLIRDSTGPAPNDRKRRSPPEKVGHQKRHREQRRSNVPRPDRARGQRRIFLGPSPRPSANGD